MATKAIIKIGYRSILLPNSTEAAKVLEILSKGMQCTEKLYQSEVELTGEALDLEMKVVPASTVFRRPAEEGGEVVDVWVGKPVARLRPGKPAKRLNGQRTLCLEDRR